MDEKDIEDKQKDLREATLKHNIKESTLRQQVFNRLSSQVNKTPTSKLTPQLLPYDASDLALQARMRQIMLHQMAEFPTAHNSTFGGNVSRKRREKPTLNFQLEGYDPVSGSSLFGDLGNLLSGTPDVKKAMAFGAKAAKAYKAFKGNGMEDKKGGDLPKEASIDEILDFLSGSGSSSGGAKCPGRKKKPRKKGGDMDYEGAAEGSGASSGGRKRKSSKKQAAGKRAAKKNPWIQHLSKVRKNYPKLSNTEVIKKAKETY